jgi:hypothetical protein
MSTDTAVAAMAVTYARAGWKVFPLWWLREWHDGLICACSAGAACKSPGKHPLFPLRHRREPATSARCSGACGQVGHGVHDATHEVRTVAAWWAINPHANIGLPAGGNDLAILDVDPRHHGDRSFIRLRTWLSGQGFIWPGGHDGARVTPVQRTGSGGEHWLFQAPPGGVINKGKAFGHDMPGLDTRGRGGYIVVAPSTHVCGGLYSWVVADPATGRPRCGLFDDLAPWPGLLSRLIDPPRLIAPVVVDADIPREFAGVDRYAAAAVVAELDEVRGSPEGQRNDTLNSAAFSVGQFVGAGRLDERLAFRELCAAARSVGLEQREIEKSVLSGLRGGKARPRRGRSGGDG